MKPRPLSHTSEASGPVGHDPDTGAASSPTLSSSSTPAVSANDLVHIVDTDKSHAHSETPIPDRPGGFRRQTTLPALLPQSTRASRLLEEVQHKKKAELDARDDERQQLEARRRLLKRDTALEVVPVTPRSAPRFPRPTPPLGKQDAATRAPPTSTSLTDRSRGLGRGPSTITHEGHLGTVGSNTDAEASPRQSLQPSASPSSSSGNSQFPFPKQPTTQSLPVQSLSHAETRSLNASNRTKREKVEMYSQQNEAKRGYIKQVDHDLERKLSENEQDYEKKIVADPERKLDIRLQMELLQKNKAVLERQNETYRNSIDAQRALIADVTLQLRTQVSERKAAEDIITEKQRENEELQKAITRERESLLNLNSSVGGNSENAQVSQDRINLMQRTLNGNQRRIEETTSLVQSWDAYPVDIVVMRSELQETLGQYLERHEELQIRNAALRRELAELQNRISEQQSLRASQLDAHNDEMTKLHQQLWDFKKRWPQQVGSYRNDWEMVYNALSEQYDQMKIKNNELYNALQQKQPDVERLERLQSEITTLESRHHQATTERDEWKDKAEAWQHECTTLNHQFDKRREELEQTISNLEQEMRCYISDYYDKLPTNDPDWWTIKGLQTKITDRDREIAARIKVQNRLRDERQAAVDKYNGLWESTQQGTPAQLYNPSLIDRARKGRKPRYMSEEETAERKRVVNAFLKEKKREMREVESVKSQARLVWERRMKLRLLEGELVATGTWRRTRGL
jgi:hypothetical protein